MLAYKAVSTFPGLEVANSYVASQTFDADRAAQLALGWTVGAEVHGSDLRPEHHRCDGAPVQPVAITAIFGRPTDVIDDQVPDFRFDGQVYRAPVAAGPGNWNLRLDATAENGTVFRQRVIVLVEP